MADSVGELAASRPGRVLALSTCGGLPGDDCWGLLRAGASDVITWREAEESSRHVADRLNRWRTIDELVACRHVQDFLVGDSAVWQSVLREAVEIARFTTAAVLITGESGTGKAADVGENSLEYAHGRLVERAERLGGGGVRRPARPGHEGQRPGG